MIMSNVQGMATVGLEMADVIESVARFDMSVVMAIASTEVTNARDELASVLTTAAPEKVPDQRGDTPHFRIPHLVATQLTSRRSGKVQTAEVTSPPHPTTPP